MSKTKNKGAKDSKPADTLSKVKAGAVTKPAQNLKNKSKELAKQVATKEEQKSKKKVKEPTPEPSSSEEESEVSSSESDSESESEVKAKPATNAKTNGVKIPAKADSSDESDADDSDDESASASDSASESEDESDSASEAEVAALPAAPNGVLEASDDSSSESDSEEEKPAKKPVAKAANTPKDVKKTEEKSDSESESDSEASEDGEDDSDSSDSDDSDASEESEKKVETKAVPKRKAEEEETPVAKKAKAELDTSKGPNLFIGNLSWNVDEAWLREEFEAYGELSGVRLMTDRQSGRSKGFGYVEFVNAADAAKAYAEKQGADLDGRPMNVDFANARPNQDQKQENRRKSYGDQVSEPSDTLFIGNLAFDVGQDAVSSAFEPYGTILGVRLPTDRESGQPKGFGYITFASVDEAKAALEAMQGFYLENRPVRLDYSQPRPQNADSPARGGFGGRGRGGFSGGRGGRGGRGDSRGGRGGGRGGRGGSTNRGGFGDFSGRKTTF